MTQIISSSAEDLSVAGITAAEDTNLLEPAFMEAVFLHSELVLDLFVASTTKQDKKVTFEQIIYHFLNALFECLFR